VLYYVVRLFLRITSCFHIIVPVAHHVYFIVMRLYPISRNYWIDSNQILLVDEHFEVLITGCAMGVKSVIFNCLLIIVQG